MLKSLRFPSNDTADDAIARLAIINVMVIVIMCLVMILALYVEIDRLKRITAPARVVIPIRTARTETPASGELAGVETPLGDDAA